MSNYKLTIITINFNNLEGLKRTVESVINQSFQDFEYIVIDGDSKDGSASYIKEMKKHFDYWVSEPDRGIYHAMNKGIEVARGEYLLFLNSGDRLFNTGIIAEIFPMMDGDIQLLYGDCMYESTSHSYRTNYPTKLSFQHFFLGGLNHQCVFFHRLLFVNYGGYSEVYKLASDWLFMMKVLFLNILYKKINCIVSAVERGGLSSSVQYTIEREHILKTEFSFLYDDYLKFSLLSQKLKSRRWLAIFFWKALIR
jgi:glycosyltransferase involved in cell wall biosynthesis